jgi:hypothetical protein
MKFFIESLISVDGFAGLQSGVGVIARSRIFIHLHAMPRRVRPEQTFKLAWLDLKMVHRYCKAITERALEMTVTSSLSVSGRLSAHESFSCDRQDFHIDFKYQGLLAYCCTSGRIGLSVNVPAVLAPVLILSPSLKSSSAFQFHPFCRRFKPLHKLTTNGPCNYLSLLFSCDINPRSQLPFFVAHVCESACDTCEHVNEIFTTKIIPSINSEFKVSSVY